MSDTTNQNPWDAPLYRRPSLVDFNDCQKQDDPNAAPPNPTTDPNAGEWNTMQFSIVAMAQMIPTAEVSVNAGSSVIFIVLSPVDTLNGNIAAFTLTRVSAGITWVELTTAGTMPALIGRPRASIDEVLGNHNYSIAATYGTGPAFGNPAVKIVCTVDTVHTDLSYTVVFR